MDATTRLAPLVLAKILEQVERTEHLLDLIPAGRLEWRSDIPGLSPSRRLDELLGHLLDCMAGFCAALYAFDPGRLAHFAKLRERPVNHRCGIVDARERMSEYASGLKEGFAGLTDQDLARPVTTVFVPEGEALLTLLLGNLEHFINHKHELFLYLKLLGVPVGTADLYHWRGDG